MCGAKLKFSEGQRSLRCGYCGDEINDLVATEPANSAQVQQATRDAISFINSLTIETRGNRVSLVELWNSYVTNRGFSLSDLIQFYKKYKPQILFCVEAYENLTDDVKYEVGDFTCSQMESIINFRENNNFIYIDELDVIEAYINQLKYDLGARGVVEFKNKAVIKEKINRVSARKTVVLYDYAMKAMANTVQSYNSQIAPLQDELNSTARTAFSRRKDLKFKINSLELQKKTAIDKLQIKVRTKEFNKVVKKYKLKHEDLLSQSRKAFDRSVYVPKNPAPIKEEIDYTAFETKDLLDAICVSIDKLNSGFTTSEVVHCKKLVEELGTRGGTMPQEANVYLNAVMMSVNSIFANENPSVMKAMLGSMGANAKMQINTLKMQLN